MGFYIPSFIQKRILRYALSKFDVLDTDALGLESLDIAWGKRSSFELRDVGLRLEALSSLLRLPESVHIESAKIRLLRLTIPADIHASGIIFEAEGLHVGLIVDTQVLKRPQAQSRKARGAKAHNRTSNAYGGNSPEGPSASEGSRKPSAEGIPTTVDLAQSFVDTELAEDKAKLKAAVAQSQNLDGSRLSDSFESDPQEGYGVPLSLPWFVADFLEGVKTRFELHIKDVQIDIRLRLDFDSLGAPFRSNGDAEDIRLRIGIHSLDLQPASTGNPPDGAAPRAQQPIDMASRRRRLSVHGINATILSDTSSLNFTAQFSSPPSPSMTHVPGFKTDSRTGSRTLTPPGSGSPRNEFAGTDSEPSLGLMPSNSIEVRPPTQRAEMSAETASFESYDSHGPTKSMTEVGSSSVNDSSPTNRYFSSTVGEIGDVDALHSSYSHGEDAKSTSDDDGFSPSIYLELREKNSEASLLMSSSNSQKILPKIGSGVLGDSPDNSPRDDGSPGSELFHSAASLGRQPSGDRMEDLTKSRVFSHAEASSMYQSAMSQAEDTMHSEESKIHAKNWFEGSSRPGAPFADGPGDDSMTESSLSEPLKHVEESPGIEVDEEPRYSADSEKQSVLQPLGDDVEAIGSLHSIEGRAAADPSSPTDTIVLIAKEFFSIATIRVEFEDSNSLRTAETTQVENPALDAKSEIQVPGGFSTSTISLSESAFKQGQSNPEEPELKTAVSDTVSHCHSQPIRVTIGNSKLICDMNLLRIAAVALQQVPSTNAVDPSQEELYDGGGGSNMEVKLERCRWHFVSELRGVVQSGHQTGQLPADSNSSENDVLLAANLEELSFTRSQSAEIIHHQLCIGKFTFGYRSEPIVSFDSSLKMRESVRDTLNTGHDVVINITARQGIASDITVMTLPLHVQLNLNRLDDTFSWIGGLSGIIEIGSSVMSNATVTEPSAAPNRHLKANRRARNVRFEESKDVADAALKSNGSPPKISARIGGLVFDLIGSKSSISIEGTAVKVVRRGDAIRFSVDRVHLKGPILPDLASDATVSLTLDLLKFAYFQAPDENDLDRLLALLAPSRDSDDSTGDILLDTFLRQRRQAPILRVNVRSCKANIIHTKDLEHLSVLLSDLKKLSPVARYLPEDDRPGLLTLAKLDSISIEVMTNHLLGVAELRTYDTEFGHVSLPSILLLGIGSTKLWHNSLELIGSVIAPETEKTPENPRPMIHVRLIGDEMDPTLKVTLWNFRVEYHVSTVMALLGFRENASGEVLIAEPIKSADSPRTSSKATSQPAVTTVTRTSKASRPMKLNVAIRDSAIGLNPRNSSARGLLHLTNVDFLGTLPDSESGDTNGLLSVHKTALLIVDDLNNLSPAKESLPTSPSGPNSLEPNQLERLKAIGYIGVSELSTASISVKILSNDSEGLRTVEILIRDDLIVIETCADSTQTLISIMNGLQPPMPPKSELKYRTEVVPVQDMLASLSGDDFAIYEGEANEVDYSTALDEDDDLDDDAPPNLEFVESFYKRGSKGADIEFDDPMLEGDVDDFSSPPRTRAIGQDRLSSELQAQYELESGGQSLHFDDAHFGNKAEISDRARRWNSRKNAYEPISSQKIVRYPFKLSLKDVHLIWNLFDGYDWQRTRDVISQAVAEVEHKAADVQARRGRRNSLGDDYEEDPVIEDFLFNSIYIGVGTNQNPRDLARNINRNIDDLVSEAESYATTTARSISSSPSRPGLPKSRKPRLRLQRSRHHKMTFELKGLCVDFMALPPGSGETRSSIDVRVRDLDIFDHVPTSTWRKFATYMHDAGERESGTDMIHLEILNVQPVPELAASEIILRVTVLPLRLHVDQDALDFLTRFFEFKDDSAKSTPSDVEAPFIQRAEVNSIPVKLDFKPKRVDYGGIRSGRTTEFMNFVILDSADMVLRHVIIYGVSGFDRLGQTLNDIWMPDVKRNQLPGVLAGLAPVRPFVNVGAGVRDLVVVPMREYRKDGRVFRSIQKGAMAFAKTTTAEVAKLGAKLAVGTHTALQSAEDALSPRPSSSGALSESPPEERPIISPYAELPIGVTQGLRSAYRQLEHDLLVTRDAIVAMPGEVMASGSAAGAARAMVRGAPTVILRPALGVTKAVGQTLMGAATTLDRGEARRMDEKYKRR